jgi:death-on-curing protein
MEPIWLTPAMIRAMHAQAVVGFRGAGGIRDEALLESAIGKPRGLHAYGNEPSVFDLAASYCFGIIQNHPFVDGNKRTGLLAANAFLHMNGYDFRPDEGETVNIIMAVADGRADEVLLSQWFADFSTPRPR